MLNRIEINDYRSCHGLVLDDLKPVTVLVGRNAVGKSNILRGIQWLAETATTGQITTPSSGSGVLQATIGGTIYRYSAQLVTTFGALAPDQKFESHFEERLAFEDSSGEERILVERKNKTVRLLWPPSGVQQVQIGELIPFMPALASLLPADFATLNLIRPLFYFLKNIRYYPLDGSHDNADDSGLVVQQTYDDWLARYQGTGDPGPSVLLRLLHTFLTNQPRFAEICSLLGPNGLGLLDDISIGTYTRVGSTPRSTKEEAGNWYYIRLIPSLVKAPSTVEFKDLSDGTRRVTKIIVSLIFDHSGVMLLEHPEDGIHAGLLRKLIKLFQGYSDQTQVIVASHSPVVFNALEPGAVRMVTMEDGTTKARALAQNELAVVGKYLEEEGSLADFLETVEED